MACHSNSLKQMKDNSLLHSEREFKAARCFQSTFLRFADYFLNFGFPARSVMTSNWQPARPVRRNASWLEFLEGLIVKCGACRTRGAANVGSRGPHGSFRLLRDSIRSRSSENKKHKIAGGAIRCGNFHHIA